MSTQFDTTISPARRQRLIWTLLGSCALAALQPGAALAQDGGAIVLDTVTVEADGAGSLLGGGYYSGIVVHVICTVFLKGKELGLKMI